MRGGARPWNPPPGRPGPWGRRIAGRRVVAAGAVLVTALALAGCADPTGEIDDQGHNGYDEMACEDAKALALDLEYGTVSVASARTRISELTRTAGKAGQAEIRQATMALVQGYRTKDKAMVRSASATLVKVCQM